MENRREIDGLRALAVLPVMLFHAGFQSFSGGFVGVDVFFVISGYLITTIILTEKHADCFSLLNFYERRARRILPALFFVMFVCIIFAWIYLLPDEMKVFGQSITASASFAANIYFYIKNNNYFGLQSEQNPTLHLWSLAVEEQYYLIFPIVIILLWKFGKNWILYALIFVSLISLAAAQWGSVHNPSATFFMLPTRGWEILMGALLAFISKEQYHLNNNPRINQLLSITGIVLIFFSIFYFDKNTPFPSAWALLPTVGAALIILFSAPGTFSSKLLGNKLFVGIGLISFSAYLWHQPLFAFNRILNYKEPSQLSFIYLILLALFLAYLTWRFIEKPFRIKNRFNRSTIFSCALLGSTAFILFGIVGHFNSGYPDRNPLYKRLMSNFGLSLQCNGNYSINSTCSTTKTPEFAFLGNSYTMHLIEGFKSKYPEKSFVQLTQDSCAPYLGDKNSGVGKLSCAEFYKLSMSTILQNPSIKFVFISSPFGELMHDKNLASLDRTVKTLQSAQKKVIIIGPTPSNGEDFGKCFQHNSSSKDLSICNFKRNDIEHSYFDVIARLKSLALKDNIKFIDLTDIICNNSTCRTSIGQTIIYRDTGHLSREGSRYIFNHLTQIFPQKSLTSPVKTE